MTNPNKAKGSQWERDIVGYLQAHGFPYAERRFGAGQQNDKGDILGIPGVTIEAKNHAKFAQSDWLAQAETERVNAGNKHGVVVVKRRGKSAGEGFVVMTLETFCEIVGD